MNHNNTTSLTPGFSLGYLRLIEPPGLWHPVGKLCVAQSKTKGVQVLSVIGSLMMHSGKTILGKL